jgi:hypothetical protein
MDKLKELFSNTGEKVFVALWAAATIAVVAFLSPGNSSVITEIVTLKMIYVTILLTATIGILFFLRGTKCDVFDEIFIEHNVAAAILAASIAISIATVIGK